MSFANMTLYNAVIPEYHAPKRKGKGGGDGGKVIRADDPSRRDEVAAMIARMV